MPTFYSKKYRNLIVRSQQGKKFKFNEHFLYTNEEDAVLLRSNIIFGDCSYEEIISPGYKFKESEKRKILVQRMGGIGDVLFTTPVIKYLHDMGNIVDYYCNAYSVPVIENNPYINKIWVNVDLVKHQQVPPGFGEIILDDVEDLYTQESKVPEKLTKEQYASYDRVICYQGAIEHNPEAEKEHAVDIMFKWAGIEPEGKEKKIQLILTEQEIEWGKKFIKGFKSMNGNKPVVGIAPNASAKIRSWEHYKKFIKQAPKEFAYLYLHSEMGWTMRQTCAIVSQLSGVIAVDSGLLHVSGALGVPIVALFGAFNPDLRCRYYDNCSIVQGDNFCYNKHCYNHADFCKTMNLSHKPTPCMNIDFKKINNALRKAVQNVSASNNTKSK